MRPMPAYEAGTAAVKHIFTIKFRSTFESINTSHSGDFFSVHTLQRTEITAMRACRANATPGYLHKVSGTVAEIYPMSKAIISFDHEGSLQRALLWADRLMVLGKPRINFPDDIRSVLDVGSMVTFQCHIFDSKGKDACGWFVVIAMRQDKRDRQMNDSFHFGIVTGQGTPAILCPRQSVLDYTNEKGESSKILCQASKIHMYGKRLTSKQKVDQMMEFDQSYQFDAVPINSLENEHHCSWFATWVWKGNRPENHRKRINEKEVVPLPLVVEMKNVTSTAKGVFWQGYGHVWAVLNAEYVLILGRIKPNRYESILAHRSCLTLSGVRAGTANLRTLFVKGDRLQFVAVPAPARYVFKWFASHISPDANGYIQKDINNLT